MATPPRLVELECPSCHAVHWEIDHNFRSPDEDCTSYEQRTYKCIACGRTGANYVVLQKSPPEFMLQPSSMYPMRQQDFDYWAKILVANFPDHWLVTRLGEEFYPNTQVFLTKLRNLEFRWLYKCKNIMKCYWYRCEDIIKKHLSRDESGNDGM